VVAILGGGGKVDLPLAEAFSPVAEGESFVGEEIEMDVADAFSDIAELVGEFDVGFDHWGCAAGNDAGEGMEAHLDGREHVHAGADEFGGCAFTGRLAGGKRRDRKEESEWDETICAHGGDVRADPAISTSRRWREIFLGQFKKMEENP